MSEDHYPYTDDGEFVPYDPARLSEEETQERASSFYELMAQRRSIRTFSSDAVPKDLIETAILTAGAAPSGAHQQPWAFVVVGDAETKRRIRRAAEEEERTQVAARADLVEVEWYPTVAPGTGPGSEVLEMFPGRGK